MFGNVETNKKFKEINVRENELNFKAELKSWKQKRIKYLVSRDSIGSCFSETEEKVEIPGEWYLIAAENEVLPEPLKARTLIKYPHVSHVDYANNSGEI